MRGVLGFCGVLRARRPALLGGGVFAVIYVTFGEGS